jgi:hypothetical protein
MWCTRFTSRRGLFPRVQPSLSAIRPAVLSRHFRQTGVVYQVEEDVDIKDFSVSQETLKKMDGLTEEEINKKKSLVQVTANVGDRSVVCFGGGGVENFTF